MKKQTIMIGALGIALSFYACKQEEVNAVAISNLENVSTADSSNVKLTQVFLPAVVQTYLSTTYPAYKFVKAEKVLSKTGEVFYLVKITFNSSNLELKFDKNGVIVEMAKDGKSQALLKLTDLSIAIQDYLNLNYPGFKFLEAEKNEVKTIGIVYEVRIKTATELVSLKFDASGKKLSALTLTSYEVSITKGDLMPAISDYLLKTYPTYVFVSAEKNIKLNVVTFKVKIKVGTVISELIFDKDGKLLSKPAASETQLTQDKLLPAIITYLNSKYAGFKLESATKYEKAGEVMYWLKITVSKITYSLVFDPKGVLVKVTGDNKTIETRLEAKELPTVAQSYLTKTYPKYVFIEGIKLTLESKITYVIKIKFNSKVYTIIFDSTGKMLSTTK